MSPAAHTSLLVPQRPFSGTFIALALCLMGQLGQAAPLSLPAALPGPERRVAFDDAVAATFPGGAPAACRSPDVRCLMVERYRHQPSAQRAALALWDEAGSVAGVERPWEMDGGFRGTVQLVPELPVGVHERHLHWTLDAMREVGTFLRVVEQHTGVKPRFYYQGLEFRYLRSVNGRSPSAYATGQSWQVGYNVDGGLMSSASAVRDVLVHEIFHLNDVNRAGWSRRTLAPMVEQITEACGTDRSCLAPYAPRSLTVRGGTFYAFQPNNGDMATEYAAEAAVRYFNEQMAALRGQQHPGGWFKCGRKENARTMELLRDEFFAGLDLTPACR